MDGLEVRVRAAGVNTPDGHRLPINAFHHHVLATRYADEQPIVQTIPTTMSGQKPLNTDAETRALAWPC